MKVAGDRNWSKDPEKSAVGFKPYIHTMWRGRSSAFSFNLSLKRTKLFTLRGTASHFLWFSPLSSPLSSAFHVFILVRFHHNTSPGTHASHWDLIPARRSGDVNDSLTGTQRKWCSEESHGETGQNPAAALSVSFRGNVGSTDADEGRQWYGHQPELSAEALITGQLSLYHLQGSGAILTPKQVSEGKTFPANKPQ